MQSEIFFSASLFISLHFSAWLAFTSPRVQASELAENLQAATASDPR